MLAIALLLSLLIASSYGLEFPLSRRSTTVSVNAEYEGNLGWTNDNDNLYTATVYVQGEPFQVQIDTGSSDLWIYNPNVTLEGLVSTGVNATRPYYDGSSVAGPIELANVTFGQYTVDGQAFINAQNGDAIDAGIYVGLLGVGPPEASTVYQNLEGTSYNGSPFLVNVFEQDPNEPSIITFLLSRSYSDRSQGGVMTISEVVAEYSNITNQPKIPVLATTFWGTVMDGVYINRVLYTGHSNGAQNATVPLAKNQTFVVHDTGTSIAYAPRYYVDLMYKNVSGAVFVDSLGAYQVPCDARVNISMVFGSQKYPINPIDATLLTVQSDGSYTCVGSFFVTNDTEVDFILGDTFMRNVYTLMNYGSNFTGHGDEAPYIQLLSITDADQAWADFEWANIERITESEKAQFGGNTSGSEAATQTTTYSLITPNITARDVSTPTHIIIIPTVTVHAGTTFLSSSSSSSPSPSTVAAQAGLVLFSSNSLSSSSSSSISTNTPLAAKIGTEAALSTTSTAAVSTAQWNTLKDTSYIIIGLLAAALALLVVVLVTLFRSSRNSRYRQIPTVIPPAGFGMKSHEAESSEAFMTPYDDMTGPLP